ncbi:cation channel sperm-associated protein subunit epsilon isoform X5 [Callorhinchus milii]|uniref:cation channel sperm-associated protein subunit epsilon isoform X5 n=1 Tax=Callorhinchus milii TaxID=7868 RepID=UPI00045737D0|nr:cation channel sperm-associated protein subunit epsilon isoform X5 [Callorhinchus milii]|eukprot:gi/632933688/ref/XP_007902293.1/ PREDICTED: uncharacterized protein C1orf101 homolog isoform X4 [Callorhinchus milii]
MGRAVCAALLLFARVGLIHGVWRLVGRLLHIERESFCRQGRTLRDVSTKNATSTNVSGCATQKGYWTNMEGRVLFDTRNSINLEYEGDSFIQWVIPDSCVINSLRTPKAVLHCSKSGMHKIELRLKKKALRIWIIDPENAVVSELNKKAESPCLVSRVLTKEFYSLGQELILTMNPTSHIYKSIFKYKKGYWKVDIYNITKEIILTISGKPVIFEDLFIKDSFYSLENSGTMGEVKKGGYLALKQFPGRNPLLIYHPCSDSCSLILTEFGTFLTNDRFITSEELKIVPTDLKPLNLQEVRAAAFLESDILFLVGDAVYLRRPKGFYLQLGPESGLPTEGLIGLLGRSHCDAVYPLKAGKKVLIAVLVWSRNSIYVGNINATFTRFNELKQSLSILNMPLDSNIDIVTVAFASRPVEFSILIQAVYQDYKRLMLIIVNDEENRWILSAMFSKLVNDSLPLNPLHMEFISSALSSVFVWNNNTIFYNLHDDKKNGKMHVNLDENISHAAEGSIIEQLVIDSNLNIIIKMSNNMLLHGVVGSDELVRLHVWEREDAKVTLYLTLLDQLYMIKVEDFKIRPTLYPLSMEKISSSLQTKSPPCPFIYFHHNKKSPIYNMDMTEELTFWAQIIYADNFGVEVEALILNHKLLELNYQINYQLHGRFYVNNKTITLTHNKDYRKAKNYMAAIKSTSGVLTLEFQPSMVSSSCIISSNTISFISVGCPPRKHIKVQRDHPVKCTFHDKQSYIISRHHVTNSLIDILAYYDKPRYGCPMQIHHKKSYKPTILLYIGEKLIEKVNVQYVIWEKYNRNDFSFNDSIKKVVCNSKTESILVKDRPHKMNNWKESIINPCTEFDYPNTSYMTLNSSSDRFLTWPTDHNALFLFHVKIVDPNFSFCNLTATFAIETYGVIIRDDIILVISLVWTFILILLCIFGYSYYKYIKIFRGMLSKPASNELYVGF